MKFITIVDNQKIEMEFSKYFEKLIIQKKNKIDIDYICLSQNSFSLILNGKSHFILINPISKGYEVIVDNIIYTVNVLDEVDMLLEKFSINKNKSLDDGKIIVQIPGLINQIFVKEGDQVDIDQKLFILEAMKMENEIISSVSGKINKIFYNVGDIVEKESIIMEISN